jgi:hypothetical protein
MTNSIRPVVAASLLAKGEAQQTSAMPCLSGWDSLTAISTVRPIVEGKSSNRSDGGWLETEWPEDSGHEAMRPAGINDMTGRSQRSHSSDEAG